MERETFIRLVTKYLEGDTDPAEERLLKDYYRRMAAKGESAFPSEEEEAVRARLLGKIQARANKRTFVARRMSWLAAAAVGFVLAVAGAGLWLDTIKTKPVNDIAPGGNKAFLTLADGTEVVLDMEKTGVLKETGNAKIVKQSGGELTYLPINEVGRTPMVFNRLSVPKGGQYKLVLPDGTKIWLNSASSVRYPTAFSGVSREVELTGEAYFEVAKDSEKPFLITIYNESQDNPVKIRVLGTHFNINAYRNEPVVKTTLLEGSVQVSKGTQKVLLHPGEQAQVANSRLKNAEILISRNVNTDGVIAWKNGLFRFENTAIKSIMMQLERWYDVEVDYDDVPNLHFSGTISRDRHLSDVLHLLELTGDLKFEIVKEKLTVKRK